MSGPALLETMVDSFRQKTRSGGTHLLYRYDHTVGPLKCAINQLVTRVDVKGHRGLLMMSPSQIYTKNESPTVKVDAPTNEEATTSVDAPTKKPKTIIRAILPGRPGHAITGQYSIEDTRQPAPLPSSLREAILEMQAKTKTDTTTTPQEPLNMFRPDTTITLTMKGAVISDHGNRRLYCERTDCACWWSRSCVVA